MEICVDSTLMAISVVGASPYARGRAPILNRAR
jgi:hypothetical protein